MTPEQLQNIIEAAILVAETPLTVSQLQKLFPEQSPVETAEIKAAIKRIQERHRESGIELKEVASGYRFQAKKELSPWLTLLWEERAPRYSRAFLETLVLIAYRQPITRAEIEDIRGVAVNSHIMKTLLEREWIRVVGYKEVPGKPGLYGTTKAFLDYFNLKSLNELPTLADIKDLALQEAKLQIELNLAETPSEPVDMTSDESETENENLAEEDPAE